MCSDAFIEFSVLDTGSHTVLITYYHTAVSTTQQNLCVCRPLLLHDGNMARRTLHLQHSQSPLMFNYMHLKENTNHLATKFFDQLCTVSRLVTGSHFISFAILENKGLADIEWIVWASKIKFYV